ncbi:MAG: hypothetical protein RIT43_1541, partial [Bacteroidota bacterium]
CTNYTVPGTSANQSAQPNNEPVYEGTQSSWVLDEVSLSDYLGQTIRVRFQFESDGGTVGDGFYFDDFKIMFNESGPLTAPVASFQVSQNSVCLGTASTFSDFSSNSPTSWSWDLGDGTTSTDQNPTHVYTSPGSYTVNLTVTNAAGTDTQSQTITVNALPSVTLTTTDADNSVCVNSGLLTLVPTPSGSTLYGPGVSGTSFDPSSPFTGVGTWYVVASYTDANGCQDSATVAVTVDACLSVYESESALLQIFPNPNKGTFTVTGLEVNNTVDVLDINGKRVFSQKAAGSKMEISLPDVTGGIYFLSTAVNGVPANFRIAILH